MALQSSNAVKTRRRRERRVDVVFEVPVFDRTELECPECGETFQVLIASTSPEPSYGNCSTWDCDAYHKYKHIRPEPEPEPEPELGPNQTLDAFATEGDP